jgi:hypothetical protein
LQYFWFLWNIQTTRSVYNEGSDAAAGTTWHFAMFIQYPEKRATLLAAAEGETW